MCSKFKNYIIAILAEESYDYRRVEAIKNQMLRDHVIVHDINTKKRNVTSFQDVLLKYDDLFN